MCVCVCYAYGASDRPASFHFLSQLPETPLISSKNQGGVILGFFLTTTPMTMSSTVTSCSTLRKCELLPGGRIYFARCTHIVSFTPGKPWPSQATPRPRVDCYCHSGTGSSTAGTTGGAPRQLPSLFQAPRQLSSLFQAPRQLSMSSLLQACHAPSLLQTLRGLSSLLHAPSLLQSAPSPRVSALPRLQSFPRLQPFHPLCSAPHPLCSALRSRLSQAPFVLRCWLWLPTNTIKGM